MERFSRTENLIGKKAVEKLKNSRVAVFGVGGVGGYCLEALARAGVGAIDVIDSDVVAESNINRQILALNSTIGRLKIDVAKERILDINPDCKVKAHKLFYLPETADKIDLKEYDYIVDAIDTVAAKLCLIERANAVGVKIISAMGAGNKLDATAFKVADIYKTSGCPLARVMRLECKKRGIKSLKVVYSEEKAIKPLAESVTDKYEKSARRSVPASISFVPSVAGLIIAGEVIKDLIQGEE